MRVRALCKVLSSVRVIEVFEDGENIDQGFKYEIGKKYGWYKVERLTISGRNYRIDVIPFLGYKTP